MIDYAEIDAAVAEQTTVEASTEAFIQGQKDTNSNLAKQIADLQSQLAGNSDAAVQAALTGLATTIRANNAHLQTAASNIVANTPAASPPDASNAPAASNEPADPNAPPPAGSPPVAASADTTATLLPPAASPV